jgi:hypothetical protein
MSVLTAVRSGLTPLARICSITPSASFTRDPQPRSLRVRATSTPLMRCTSTSEGRDPTTRHALRSQRAAAHTVDPSPALPCPVAATALRTCASRCLV